MRHNGCHVAETDTAPPRSRRGLWLRLLLSVVLAAALVVALRPYLQAVPEDLSIPPWVVLAYLLTLAPYHLLRAGRWQFLVAPLCPPDAPVPTRDVLRVGLAGYMWIAVLPFRLGELARPLFLAQRSKVTVSRALGTIAIERVVDGLLVCALFFVGIAGLRPSDDLTTFVVGTGIVMGAFMAALLVLLVMALRPNMAARLTDALVGWISPKLADAMARVARGVGEGLRALPSARPLATFVGVSILYWSANAAGMWLLAWGCGLPIGFQGAVVLLAVMNLVLIIPGGPAQVGTFQGGVAAGLHLLLPATVVMAGGSKFAFYLYVTQLSTIVALGLLSQWSLKLDWRAVLRLPKPPT